MVPDPCKLVMGLSSGEPDTLDSMLTTSGIPTVTFVRQHTDVSTTHPIRVLLLFLCRFSLTGYIWDSNGSFPRLGDLVSIPFPLNIVHIGAKLPNSRFQIPPSIENWSGSIFEVLFVVGRCCLYAIFRDVQVSRFCLRDGWNRLE